MFPHKRPATPIKGTLPRHICPKSVRHDVSDIRRRAKAIRRLIKHETKPPTGAQEEPPPKDPSLPLWFGVDTPLSLRTILSPPPKNQDTLRVRMRPNPIPMDSATRHAAHECFKGLRKAIRLLIPRARNFRRLKYGKSLLRMFGKNPSVALKSILRNSEGTSDNPTLPTDISILREIWASSHHPIGGFETTYAKGDDSSLPGPHTPSGRSIPLPRPRPANPHLLGSNADRQNHSGYLPRSPSPHAKP